MPHPPLLSAHPTRNTGWHSKAQPRRAPTTLQQLLGSVAGHSLGVLALILRCLLSPLVLPDTSSRPLMPSQAHPGLSDEFEDWQLIFPVLQSFFSLRNFLPKRTDCCAHLKGRVSLPPHKAGCDLPSWKSFTVSGDSEIGLTHPQGLSLKHLLLSTLCCSRGASPAAPAAPRTLTPSPWWRLCLLLEPAPQLQSLLPAEKERVT